MNTLRELFKIMIPSTKRHRYHMLFDFSNPATVELFRFGSDSYYGGSSFCSFERNEQNGSVVFQGSISTKMPEHTELAESSMFNRKKRILRTGFAGFTSELSWVHRLGVMREFNAVEIVGRGDNKVYNLNIKPEGFSHDDLYQAKVSFADAATWNKRIVKFEDLVLTGFGRVKGVQRTFDHGAINSLGMSIADKQEGPFRLELKSIALLNTELNNDENS